MTIQEQFEAFKAALYEHNQVKNLTRIAPEDCDVKHFADSLLFLDLIPQGSRLLDIGTGAGFPAWPIACARPDIAVTAVDSNGKMLDFLRSQPLPNLTVRQWRIEDSGTVEMFDIVTGRALAPLGVQLEISAAPLVIGGRLIAMRSSHERELIEKSHPAAGQVGLKLIEILERPLEGTEIVRLLPIYEKTKPTPPPFPRRWADITKRPLLKG